MVDFKVANDFTYIYDGSGNRTVVEPTKDLVIRNGKLLEATGVDEVTQRIRTRLAKQLGEWRYNQDSGVPWMDYGGTPGLLGARNSTNRAKVIIEGIINATDGVKAAKTVQVRWDTTTRKFTMQLEVETIYGSAIMSV